jgi:uncharacterized protein
VRSGPGETLLAVVLQDLVFFVLTVGFFWLGVYLSRRILGSPTGYSLASLGFSRPTGGYTAGAILGFWVGCVAIGVSLVITPLTSHVFEELGYPTESKVQGPFMEGLAGWIGKDPGTAIPAIIAVVIFFGPAIEELVFRGAIFGGLYRLCLFFSRKLGVKAGVARKETGEKVSFALAALVSSVPFALAHLEPVALPMLLILAVSLCALYRRTGSLLPNLVAHATFNSFAVLLIILSGLRVLPLPA